MRIKTFKQFNESLTVSSTQLTTIGDIADKVDWQEGQKFAFVDFRGIRNIPVNIDYDNELELEEELEKT